MDVTTMRIIATLVSLATFLAIGAWAYSRRNKSKFDEAAQLPFEQE